MSLTLRVLYTINSSPQYILARSPSPVPITPITSQPARSSTSTLPHYGTALLKTCLEVICRSSPELIQDSNRDFSVYVLDPLESNTAPPPVNLSHNDPKPSSHAATTQPRGVAVGLGLMSLAMDENADPVPVTGTFMTMGTGQQALEVIFALRETFPVQRRTSQDLRTCNTEPPLKKQCVYPVSSSQESSSSTSSAVASVSANSAVAPKEKKPSRANRGPITESDRFLEEHEAYMGYRKKGRRPKAPTAENGSRPPAKAERESPEIRFSSTSQPLASSSNTTALTKNLTACSSGAKVPNLLEILTALAKPASSDAMPNDALLSALSNIDASSTSNEENPGLVNAMKQLLGTLAQQATPTQHLQSQSTAQPTTQVKSEPQDEEVVILDKENINPGNFKKKNAKDDGLKVQGSSSGKPLGSGSANILGPGNGQSIQRSAPQLATRTNDIHTKTQLSSSSTAETYRKRTLSDFMEERESTAGSSSGSHRRRSSSSRKERPLNFLSQPYHSSVDISNSALRHYPRLIASAAQPLRLGGNSYYRMPTEIWSSPQRPSRELPTSSTDENSKVNPIVISDSPVKSQVPASSPPRPSRKRYVVPAWARTSTATQPRFSEETQRMIEEAKAKKREEKLALRRKHSVTPYARAKQQLQDASIPASESDENSIPKAQSALPSPPPPVPKPPAAPLRSAAQPGPIAASAEGPLIGVGTSEQHSDTSSGSRLPPITPPRRRSLPTTPPTRQRRESGSLFTPTPNKSWKGGSPLFSPTFGIAVSPNPIRKAAQGSPTRHRKSSRQGPWVPPSSSTLPSESQKSSQEDEDEDFLNQELENPIDDPPPSTLPVASSDAPTEALITTPDQGAEGDDEADPDNAVGAIQQHWQGLPPSSPPATSPMMYSQELPSYGDDDLDELPTATSDFEDISATTSPDDITSPPEVTSPADVQDQTPSHSQDSQQSRDILQIMSQDSISDGDSFAAYLNDGALADFGPLFADMEKSVDGMDLLEQFTNHALLSPDSLNTPQGTLSTAANTPNEADTAGATATLPMTDAASLGLEDPAMFRDGVVEFDLSGFWETFKPLIENQGGISSTETIDGTETLSASQVEGSTPPTAGANEAELAEVDHVKLADDIRALFSGCLM